MTKQPLTIREATQDDDDEIAQHLYHLMVELGASAQAMAPDWLYKTHIFIEKVRQDLHYQGFIAEMNDQVVGSVSCQILELYPILNLEYQKGYIWGLYVAPSHRRQGIATQLMQAAQHYLQSIGCTRAVLHASETGRGVYERLDYLDSNEMTLNLT
ncbi:MAG: GNAT family N-acetyltransferase [Cyanobacteria bacterium P01_H01_bin.105]